MKALSPISKILPPPFPKHSVGFISKPDSSCYESRSSPPGMAWTAAPENYWEFTCTWLVSCLRPIGPCLPHHIWERCMCQFGKKNKTVWEIPPTPGTTCLRLAVKEMIVNFSSWLLEYTAYSTLCKGLSYVVSVVVCTSLCPESLTPTLILSPLFNSLPVHCSLIQGPHYLCPYVHSLVLTSNV
jgi:hypothetical protein